MRLLALGLSLVLTTAAVFGAPASQPSPAGKRLLWDAWYTRTVGGLRYSYYQETVTEQGGRIHVQTHEFKDEEGFLNEEHLGVLADGKTLKPYTAHGTFRYRSTELEVDVSPKLIGSTTDPNRLEFRLQPRAEGALPRRSIRTLPKGVFFSTHFGLWLHRLRPTKRTHYSALREDDRTGEFPVIKGWVDPVRGKPDTYEVNYGGLRLLWTLDADGAPSRIEVPSQGQVTVRVSRAEAESFLSK